MSPCYIIFTLFFVVSCFIQLIQANNFSKILEYRRGCIQKLGLNIDNSQNFGPFNLLTNSQFHDLQCLERCVLIERGIMDEDEILQENKLKEEFPNLNVTIDLNQICPTIANASEKCEKGYLIGKCIQLQTRNPKWKHHKRPYFKSDSSPERQQYRTECFQEIFGGNSSTVARNVDMSDQRMKRFGNDRCVERCVMIKMGILDENNVIQSKNITQMLNNDQTDVSQCSAIKNEDKCMEAVGIKRCLNRIPLLHI